MTKKIANVTVGKPDTKPSKPSHISGVHQGNSPTEHLRKQDAITPQELGATGSGRRSTGINADNREPIDPRMPKLSPP